MPNKVRIYCPEIGQTYTITNEPTQHAIAHISGGRINANWYIQDNYVIAKAAESPAERPIDIVYKFELQRVTTEQMEYSKFKFVD